MFMIRGIKIYVLQFKSIVKILKFHDKKLCCLSGSKNFANSKKIVKSIRKKGEGNQATTFRNNKSEAPPKREHK